MFCLPILLWYITIFTLKSTSSTKSQELNLEEKYMAILKPHYDEMKASRTLGSYGHLHQLNTSICSVSQEILLEISSLKPVVTQIVESILSGKFKGVVYQELKLFLTTFGARPSGSDNLENAITYLEDKMKSINLENIQTEPVQVPIWERGIENCSLLAPTIETLEIKGYGVSAKTPTGGIEGDVILIETLKQAEDLKSEIKGKIVLFVSSTDDDEIQCLFGPAAAARYGAIGVLCKSPYKNLYTVVIMYDTPDAGIPAAFLAQNDANTLANLYKNGDKLKIHLILENGFDSSQTRNSRNLIGDLIGKDKPNEYVLFMSHADSWDQGNGAHDDGVGIFLGLVTQQIIKELGIKTRRTIKHAIFTTEEIGLTGVTDFVSKHKNDLENYSAAVEADQGCIQAAGLTVSGISDAACIVLEIEKLYQEVSKSNELLLTEMETLPTNMLLVHGEGVPGIELNGDRNGEYFGLHHSVDDTIDFVDSEQIDKCLALTAATAYVVAELKDKLPRK